MTLSPSTRLGAAALALTGLGLTGAAFLPAPGPQADDASPPDVVVKLVFIHHSTGENWLNDEDGGLGRELGENNYFVSDTNYGWGPDAIGDRTDIPDWLEWFRGENTEAVMEAVYTESGQNAWYTRDLDDPGGANEIVLFKSCFPNSNLEGSPDDPPTPDPGFTVGHFKYVYNEILPYFASRPDKLFVVITAPPVQDPTWSENARAFNDWLREEWLEENEYAGSNVAVFDFYNVLTAPEAHHRFANGGIEHTAIAGRDTSYYPTAEDDDHPNGEGNRKATEEFVPVLNVLYHRWQAGLTDSPQRPAATDSATSPQQPSGPSAIEAVQPEDEVPASGSPAGLPCLGGAGPLGLAVFLARGRKRGRDSKLGG